MPPAARRSALSSSRGSASGPRRGESFPPDPLDGKPGEIERLEQSDLPGKAQKKRDISSLFSATKSNAT